MARYAGLVGYVTTEETFPGVWSPVERPKVMKGDIIRMSSAVQSGDKINDDISLNHRVSLIGDAYSFGNYYNIKWIELDGRKLKVDSVEIQRPRLILSLGGVYNG